MADIEVGDNEGVMPRSVRLLFDLTKKENPLGKRLRKKEIHSLLLLLTGLQRENLRSA